MHRPPTQEEAEHAYTIAFSFLVCWVLASWFGVRALAGTGLCLLVNAMWKNWRLHR